ncbi:MAG: DUF4136 domain-containing protein [Hahellaceae bacterium]|nr:DUF4136 domain-containing protein [Hahellaceae bacterium]
MTKNPNKIAQFFRHITVMITFLVTAGCGNSLTIDTEYSKATNFDDFKYYRWHQGAAPTPKKAGEKEIDDILDANIRLKIDQELARKGMVKKDAGVVDFLVNYTISAKNQVDVEKQRIYDGYSVSYQPVAGAYGRYGGYGYARQYYTGVAMTATPVVDEETVVTRYIQGAMSIDFIEPDDNKLIWRATGDKRLADEKRSTDERDALINSTIEKLLAKFPPK